MSRGCCVDFVLLRFLAKGEKLLILGNWEEAPESGGTLELDADSVVLPLTRRLEREITRLSKDCS